MERVIRGWIPEGLREHLGNDLFRVVAEDLDQLILHNISERNDLEFKSRLWDCDDQSAPRRRSKKDRGIELARALVQFANADGGLLIVGAAEGRNDNRETVSSFEPLSAKTKLRSRIEDVVNSTVSPRLKFDFYFVAYREGVVAVISVPPSISRPHAVREGVFDTYPIRSGSRKTYMREPEIASAYRDRFSELDWRTNHLEKTLSQARDVARRAPSYLGFGGRSAKLVIASVPDIKGLLHMSDELLKDYSEWTGASLAWLPRRRRSRGWSSATPGQFAIRFGARPERLEQWPLSYRDVHGASLSLDGSGWAIFDMTSYLSADRHNDTSITTARFRTLTLAVFSVAGLRLLGGHASRSEATGPLHLAAQLVASGGDDMGIAIDRQNMSRSYPAGDVRIVQETERVEMSFVPERLLSDGKELLECACSIGSEILRAFGIMVVPEISSDCQQVLASPNKRWRLTLDLWAEEYGIPVVEQQSMRC